MFHDPNTFFAFSALGFGNLFDAQSQSVTLMGSSFISLHLMKFPEGLSLTVVSKCSVLAFMNLNKNRKL